MKHLNEKVYLENYIKEKLNFTYQKEKNKK